VLTAEREGKLLEFPADKIPSASAGVPSLKPRPRESRRAARREETHQGRRPSAHHRTRIWAIGDVVAGPMLAHKAERRRGRRRVDRRPGRPRRLEPDAAVIYTDPELAGVGLGEDGAKTKGLDVHVASFLSPPTAGRSRLTPPTAS